jgi:uridine kinase
MLDLAERIKGTQRDLGRSILVGISGVDYAGKSTLAERLVVELSGSTLVLAGDEMTRPSREREDYLESFEYTQVFTDLRDAVLMNEARTLTLRMTDWENDRWRLDQVELLPDAVVIVEGCFLFTPLSAGVFDVAIWIDLPLNEVVERAVRRPRDLARMGGEEGVRRRYAERYLPA